VNEALTDFTTGFSPSHKPTLGHLRTQRQLIYRGSDTSFWSFRAKGTWKGISAGKQEGNAAATFVSMRWTSICETGPTTCRGLRYGEDTMCQGCQYNLIRNEIVRTRTKYLPGTDDPKGPVHNRTSLNSHRRCHPVVTSSLHLRTKTFR
jgi:hypothetical protein